MNKQELYDNNELIPYKNKILNALAKSTMLYELVLNTPCDNVELMEGLRWVNYIPHLYVDGTIKETEAYVMFDIDQRTSPVDAYNTYNIYFQIICHKSIAHIASVGATRCDCIISELCHLFKDKMLNADNGLGLGKNLKTHDRVINPPNNNFIARELAFSVTDFDERLKKRHG